MELTKREIEMGTGKTVPLLFKFGIPTMLGMIINALYNLVDTYFIGSFGMVPTAAVSLVFPLTLIVTGLGTCFGNGTGSKVSRLLGDKQHRQASEFTSTALVGAVVCGLVLSAGLLLGLRPILTVLGADGDTLPYAVQYGTIIIAGFVFSVFNITVNNIIVSEGATVFTSGVLVMGAVMNMVLDPLFIYAFHTGVEGVAYATVISSAASSLVYVLYFVHGKGLLKFSSEYVKPSGYFFANVLKIGVPMLIFQMLNMATLTVTNTLAVKYGNPSVAAFGITYKLFCLEINAVFGFLKGYQPLAGYNYGATDYDRVARFTREGILITTIFCVVCNVLLMIFAPQAIRLFNRDSAEVLAFGVLTLRVQAVGYMTLAFQFVGASYFLAIGDAKNGGVLSLCRGVLFLLFALLLNGVMGRTGLLAAFPATELVSSGITAVQLIKSEKQANALAAATM